MPPCCLLPKIASRLRRSYILSLQEIYKQRISLQMKQTNTIETNNLDHIFCLKLTIAFIFKIETQEYQTFSFWIHGKLDFLQTKLTSSIYYFASIRWKIRELNFEKSRTGNQLKPVFPRLDRFQNRGSDEHARVSSLLGHCRPSAHLPVPGRTSPLRELQPAFVHLSSVWTRATQLKK